MIVIFSEDQSEEKSLFSKSSQQTLLRLAAAI